MTKLVGILNLTPDSFSDGGQYDKVSAALARIEELIEHGADVIDIGAESTRPGATPMSAAQEWERLAPLFAALKIEGAIFSLDTRHAENAKRALDKGFHWINDVTGGTLAHTLGGYDATLIAMHSLTVPADKNVTLPEDTDVIEVLRHWALGIRDSGVKNLIIDPGLGFGKTPQQSWQIIERIGELKALGLPLLVGHSRKSFLGDVDRDAATLEVSMHLIAAEVDYLRVHDVAAHRTFLEMVNG